MNWGHTKVDFQYLLKKSRNDIFGHGDHRSMKTLLRRLLHWERIFIAPCVSLFIDQNIFFYF